MTGKLSKVNATRTSPSNAQQQGPTNDRRKTPLVTISHQLLEVPLEVWEQVAVFSGRQAIARLCVTSNAFYSGFAPLLYSITSDPALTVTQSQRLVLTLSQAKSSPRIPPLIGLIKSVSFAGSDLRLCQCEDALSSLFGLSPSGLSIRGATLRRLTWNFPATYDQALSILLRPGCFPNIKEISVTSSSVGEEGSFDYLRIPGLEKLECSWTFINQHGPRTFSDLAEALELLPSSSPLLHTLKLRLDIDYWYHSSSPDVYDEPIRAINQLHFPKLDFLEVFVDRTYCRDTSRTDFGQLLFNNRASLRDVVVDVSPNLLDGSETWHGPAISSFEFSRLRAFTGSLRCCALVAAHAPQLEYVTMTRTNSKQFTAVIFPPNVGLQVRHLTVRGNHETDIIYDFPCQLSPQLLDVLVGAFPNLTHLDVRLDGRTFKMSDYRDALVRLHDIEYLRLYRVIAIGIHYQSAPAAVIFPVNQYADKINETLRPFLLRLSEVHMSLFGTDNDWEYCLRRAEYRFCRESGGAKLVFVSQ
ncbi:hypothetical protein DFH06DRAFT_1210582 [Mycena polygramma]|nr:hypothetical protein DFH06DRAFT_1210582 [Mycena polygramma]